MSAGRDALLVAVLLAAACRVTDPAYLTSDGKKVSNLDPIPYRIAVAPVESGGRLDGARREGEPYWFTLDDDGMQALLVAVMDPDEAVADAYGLETQRAANIVFPIGEREMAKVLDEAQRHGADLVVVPRVIELPRFAYDEHVRTLPSVAWWLFTWVGGLFVQDKRYEARMTLDFEVVNALDGTTLDTFTATSESMELTLWERDGRRFGRRCALSLILPPQWTGDTRSRVSDTLSVYAGARCAARFSAYLKQDFRLRERSLIGAVHGVRPPNGAHVGAMLPLRAEIIGEQPITHVALYLNGSREPVFELREDGPEEDALALERQASGTHFHVSVARTGAGGPEPVRIPLAAGRNEVRLEYAVLGRYASRTFVYWNG